MLLVALTRKATEAHGEDLMGLQLQELSMAMEEPELQEQAQDGRREETVKDILSGEEQLIPSHIQARKKKNSEM